MQTTVRFRAYPVAEQKRLWGQHDGNCRAVFNLCLNLTLDLRRARGVYVEDRLLSAQLTELRNDPDAAPWLRETPLQVLQQAVRQHGRAWANMGYGARRPRFRKKSGEQSFTLPQDVRVRRHSRRWGSVVMPGGGRERLKVRWHRTPPGTVKSATYVREADGTYWVSLVCETRERAPTKHLNDVGPTGVDLGVEVPVATSDGEMWTFSALNSKEQERLLRLERRLARQPKTVLPDGRKIDGANRTKTKAAIAKLKARARRRRHDFAEQVSNMLTNSHGVIVFEQLPIEVMTRSAKGTVDQPGSNVRQKSGLNRSILDVGWGRIVQRTKDKAVRRGATVVQVPAAYTSQTCPDCGTVDGSQRVSRSKYECRTCGYQGHADTGAARNILARGMLASADGTSVAACGDFALAGSAKQENENGYSAAPAAA
jgi:putative transposase